MRMVCQLRLLFPVSPSLTSLKEEDRLARELEDCMKQLELQEDQSSLGRVCSRLVGNEHSSRPASKRSSDIWTSWRMEMRWWSRR